MGSPSPNILWFCLINSNMQNSSRIRIAGIPVGALLTFRLLDFCPERQTVYLFFCTTLYFAFSIEVVVWSCHMFLSTLHVKIMCKDLAYGIISYRYIRHICHRLLQGKSRNKLCQKIAELFCAKRLFVLRKKWIALNCMFLIRIECRILK